MRNSAAADTQVEPGFDLVTHKRDKFGKVISINPYRCHIQGGMRAFERPVNSGNLWYENGKPCGRLIDGKISLGVPHEEWSPPASESETLADEIVATRAQSEALRAELDALRAESEALKAKVANQTTNQHGSRK